MGGHVVEQIAEDHHHAAVFQPFGQIVKNRARGRFPRRGLRHPSHLKQLLHVMDAATPARKTATGPIFHVWPNG